MSLTQMLPHFPVFLRGTVWGLPSLVPQKPRLTGTMESFAMMMAPRMAVATSLLHFTPSPTWQTDGIKVIESGLLSSPGLLLDRHDLQNLVLKGGSKEEVNDLMLLGRNQINSE